MPRSLRASISAVFGYRPPGRDWAQRLSKLNGRFRRSTSENLYRLFIGASALFTVALVLARESSKPGFGDLREPFLLIVLMALGALAFYILWPIGQTYVFKSGTLRCELWTGRVLWHEDISQIEYVTCSAGRGITWLVLKLPNRRRRIELLDSLEATLSRPRSKAGSRKVAPDTQNRHTPT